jgi:hypothetical protein
MDDDMTDVMEEIDLVVDMSYVDWIMRWIDYI